MKLTDRGVHFDEPKEDIRLKLNDLVGIFMGSRLLCTGTVIGFQFFGGMWMSVVGIHTQYTAIMGASVLAFEPGVFVRHNDEWHYHHPDTDSLSPYGDIIWRY